MKRGIAVGVLALVATAATAQAVADPPLAIGQSDKALAWGPCPPIFGDACTIAVLHGDPAKPNADVFLRVRPGATLPAHRHSSAERMILVGGQLRVEYRGRPPRVLRAGDYAYGPARAAHSATCLGRAACTLFIAFEGPVDAELD